jgi:glycine dehydrogenase subunit 2
LQRIGEFATLNANYLLKELERTGFVPAFPKRRASHEFIITAQKSAKEWGVSAMDYAKRMLDYGVHAPTVYFPLLIPECMLIEPTESESKAQMDAFVEIMAKVLQEAKTDPDKLHGAPYTLPVRRLDDVKAAKELNLVWREGEKA